MVADEQLRTYLQIVALEAQFVEGFADKVESNSIDFLNCLRCQVVLQGPLPDGNLVPRKIVVDNDLCSFHEPFLRLEGKHVPIEGDHLREFVGPVIQQLSQEVITVLEVPVKPRFGDTQRLGKPLHRKRSGSSLAQCPQSCFEPLSLGDAWAASSFAHACMIREGVKILYALV